MLRTLRFADNYYQTLLNVIETTAPVNNAMRGALVLLDIQQLPIAKDWRQRTYDAVINNISNNEINIVTTTTTEGSVVVEDEEGLGSEDDDEESSGSEDDQGSDVEEELEIEEAYEEEER